MSKFIDFIGEVADYIFKHLSAIVITGMIISIGMLNPFVVEKYKPIYTYQVSKAASAVWDIVFVLAIITVWNIDKWIETHKTKK